MWAGRDGITYQLYSGIAQYYNTAMCEISAIQLYLTVKFWFKHFNRQHQSYWNQLRILDSMNCSIPYLFVQLKRGRGANFIKASPLSDKYNSLTFCVRSELNFRSVGRKTWCSFHNDNSNIKKVSSFLNSFFLLLLYSSWYALCSILNVPRLFI